MIANTPYSFATFSVACNEETQPELIIRSRWKAPEKHRVYAGMLSLPGILYSIFNDKLCNENYDNKNLKVTHWS
jgi:hypothetical protein